MNKDNKTALITGSGQNIGRGIARHLGAAGFNIILNGSANKQAKRVFPAKYARKVAPQL